MNGLKYLLILQCFLLLNSIYVQQYIASLIFFPFVLRKDKLQLALGLTQYDALTLRYSKSLF